MIIHHNPRRTKILLRIRRIITARLDKNKPNWDAEDRAQQVTADMKALGAQPMSRLRLYLHALETGAY